VPSTYMLWRFWGNGVDCLDYRSVFWEVRDAGVVREVQVDCQVQGMWKNIGKCGRVCVGVEEPESVGENWK